jgi:YD repeat-containing protein
MIATLDEKPSYDLAGNRLRRELTEGFGAVQVTTYAYNAADQLLTEVAPAGTTTYAYDDNGNQTERSGPGGLEKFGYDFEDRQVSYDAPGTASVPPPISWTVG